jgi:nitrogen-specific signal transduction histidine kinase
LNGDFRSKKYSTSRDEGFFKLIIDKLPNSIIIANSDGQIIIINKSASDHFGETSFAKQMKCFTGNNLMEQLNQLYSPTLTLFKLQLKMILT